MRRFNVFSHIYAAAMVVVLSLAVPVVAGQDQSVPNIHIKNFGQINDRYYRGAQPNGQDYADLATLGIKTVINLIGDDADPNEQAMVEKVGMKYHLIPMTTHEAPTPAKLTEFLRIATDAASLPIYVHCVGGRHRTGVMTAVYRMTQEGWTADQAFKEMKQFEFGADFLHREFKNFVYEYYTQLAHAPKAPDKAVATAAVN